MWALMHGVWDIDVVLGLVFDPVDKKRGETKIRHAAVVIMSCFACKSVVFLYNWGRCRKEDS